MKNTLAAFALALGLCAGLVAAATAADREPIAGRTQPVQNSTGKTIKIGLISFPESNEFFSSVKVGSDAAADVLKKFDAQVQFPPRRCLSIDAGGDAPARPADGDLCHE